MLKNFEIPQKNEDKNHGRALDNYKSEMMNSLQELAEGKAEFNQAKGFICSLIKGQDEKGFWSLIPSPEVGSDIRGRLDALQTFSKSQVFKFIDKYPDFSHEFEIMIVLIYNWLCGALKKGNTKGDLGEDYKDDMYKTMKALEAYTLEEDIKIFVYGTLMKGGSNFARFLSNAEFLGKYTAEDFALYDLGAYPGVVYGKGDKVKGELYKINGDILKNIDRLEGQGSLYLRFSTHVVNVANSLRS